MSSGGIYYLVMVAIEELEEAGLSSSGSFDASEPQVILGPLQIPQVHQEVLNPEASPLTNRCQLGGPTVHNRCSCNVTDLNASTLKGE